MNLATFLVLSIVIVLVILDILYMSKHGIDSCGGDCSGCHGSCKWANDVKKAQKAIARQKKIQAIFHLGKEN